MSKKTHFNRIDMVKDSTARTELSRAHMMIALLGATNIGLLWMLYSSASVSMTLAALATALLLLVILFSLSVSFAMLKKPRK